MKLFFIVAAQKKFPGLTGGRFGSYVNNKLGNLRHKKKAGAAAADEDSN
jgi:hypothetical protein